MQLGSWEIVLVLALVLVLFGSNKLPELAKGLRQGIFEFRKLIKRIFQAADDEATEAGRSLGGIYGKPAAEALTPDNHVAELYDPAVLENEPPSRERPHRLTRLFAKMLEQIRRLLRLNRLTS